MAHRHFGLGHYSPRSSSRRTPGYLRQLLSFRRELSFRAGDWAERVYENAYDRLSEAYGLAASVIAVWARVFHDEQNCTSTHQKTARVRGKIT